MEYELNIDWLPRGGHKLIKIMLAHDFVAIINTNDAPVNPMQIVCREKYEIQWPEKPWQNAPAKTRVRRADPIHLLNSNCG